MLRADGKPDGVGLDALVQQLFRAELRGHRFSLSFQQQTHKKKTYELELTKIKGS